MAKPIFLSKFLEKKFCTLFIDLAYNKVMAQHKKNKARLWRKLSCILYFCELQNNQL